MNSFKKLCMVLIAFAIPLITNVCTAKITDIAGTKKTNQQLNKAAIAVAKFHADWCPACKSMNSIDTAVEAKFANKKNKNAFAFLRINADQKENKELVVQYKVQGLPTYCFFKYGKLQSTIVGAMSQEDFEAKINAMLR